MINNYLRQGARPPIQITYQPRQHKLIIALLARSANRALREGFASIQQRSRQVGHAVGRVVAIAQKNNGVALWMALNRLKVQHQQEKGHDKAFKSLNTLLLRMERYKTQQCFHRLALHAARCNSSLVDNFVHQRKQLFARKLLTVVRHRKQGALGQLKGWSQFVKSYSRLRIVLTVHDHYAKYLKRAFFSRAQRNLFKREGQARSARVSGVGGGSREQREINELRVQMQDMTVQLENKKESIQRLEEEIGQMRVEQSNVTHNVSYGEYNTNRSLRGPRSQQKINHSGFNSNQDLNLNDMSIGSILGNLNKSRTGSVSRLDSAYDCNCGFKTKYKKYKSLNESLKNQLEIVKEELEVAKDLNEHFTNEIRTYLTGEAEGGDYEKLKKEHQAVLNERDQLRQKVFKYQKHITNMKAEFKIKMEELYRKVRKDM